MLILTIGNIINHAIVHGPHIVLPLSIFSIFYMLQLTVFKGLHGNTFHSVGIRHKLTSINQLFNFAFLNFLDDNMLLRLRGQIALYLIFQHITVGLVSPRHHIFVEHNSKNADQYAQNNRRKSNPVEANATGLHSCYLAIARKPAYGQQTGQQHGHRKSPNNNARQAQHKNLDNRWYGSPIFCNVLGDAEQST